MTTDHFILSAAPAMRAQGIARASSLTRSYLHGVFVEPIPDGGAFLVATDGHIMLIHRDKLATAPRAAILELTEPVAPPPMDEDDDGGWFWEFMTIVIPATITPTAPIVASGYSGPPDRFDPAKSVPSMHLLAQEIAGTFPDWRKAAGGPPPNTAPLPKPQIHSLSPILLARLAGDARGMTIHQISIHADAARLITFDDQPDTLALIMPRSQDRPEINPLHSMLQAIGRADLLHPPRK